MAPGQTDVDLRVPAISAVTSATRIFRNLRGEALRLCEDLEVAELNDANHIVKALRQSASEGQLRIIPRVYDALFRQT